MNEDVLDNNNVAEKFGYVTITIMAFAVGMLLGGRYCQKPADVGVTDDKKLVTASDKSQNLSDCPERIVEKIIKSPAQIIYQCPPKEKQPLTKGKGGPVKKKKVKKKVDLPPPEPDFDPLERKRLLAWVRDQSSSLKRCRDNSKDVYRVAVILHLHTTKKTIRRVDVNADRSKVSAGLVGCLRQQMLAWTPPKNLVQQRSKLVFGLNI